MKNVTSLALLLSLLPIMKTQAVDDPAGLVMTTVSIEHVTVRSHRDFASTIRELEAQIGTFDPSVVAPLAADPPGPVEPVRANLQKLAGKSGFMQFGRPNAFGFLLPLVGRPKGKANGYLIGNPLIAVQMIQYNPAAGLYVPLRVLVREDETGATYFEYDRPSSLLKQLHDNRITAVALMLDQKLEALINDAAGR